MKSLLAVCVLALASCASIITGTEDSVQILSNPPGAAFTTNSGHKGETPASVTIPDDLDLEVSYVLAGYEDQKVLLPSRMSGWVWGNILLGGIIGLIIDFASGHHKTHDSTVTATLVPLAEG